MKRRKLNKLKKVLLVVSLLVVASVITFTTLKWDEKLARSSTEATQMLESEGIKIRTVDTSKLVEKDEMNEEVLEKEAEQTRSSSDTTEGTEQTSADSDTTEDTEQTTPPKEQPTKPTEQTNSQQAAQENGQTNETTTGEPAKEEVKSLLEIKQTYMGQFLTLESEISASLDVILEEALTDYQTKKANNEEIKVSEFQAKYATKVLNLEATSDSQFNEIYRQLEAELVANGYDLKEAQPYRAQYRAEKQNREQKAIEKFSSMR